MFGVIFPPSEWSGPYAIYHLGDMSLHKDRELQKFDLAKKMLLSGLLPQRRNWLFTEKFQLFLNGE